MKLKNLIIALAVAALLPFTAAAHNHANLELAHSWIKQPIPGMQMTGGFITITNNGANDEQFIAVHSDIANKVELHTMVMVDGVMKMRAVENGWSIPAGETKALKPGSDHIMFIGLQQHIKEGDTITLQLEFKHAGKIEHSFKVQASGAMGEDMSSQHSH